MPREPNVPGVSRIERKVKKAKRALQKIIDYPRRGKRKRKRCTDDGYPTEFSYDEFAYRRMVDSYRSAIESVIKDIDAE